MNIVASFLKNHLIFVHHYYTVHFFIHQLCRSSNSVRSDQKNSSIVRQVDAPPWALFDTGLDKPRTSASQPTVIARCWHHRMLQASFIAHIGSSAAPLHSPVQRYFWRPINGAELLGLPGSDNILPFCFPAGIDVIKPKEYAASEVCVRWTCFLLHTTHSQSYIFTLTVGDGSRLHGFCRRFLPPRSTSTTLLRLPVVACLITPTMWVDFMHKVAVLIKTTAKLSDRHHSLRREHHHIKARIGKHHGPLLGTGDTGGVVCCRGHRCRAVLTPNHTLCAPSGDIFGRLCRTAHFRSGPGPGAAVRV